MNECYTSTVFLAVDMSFDFVKFLEGVTMVYKVMCGLRYQDNLLFNPFDRLHLNRAIKMKNPIHKPQCSLDHYVGVQHFFIL